MAFIHWVCSVTVLLVIWELPLSCSLPVKNTELDNKALDVIFLIDRSNSVLKVFNATKKFLEEFVKRLKVEENNIRIAAISFFKDSTIEFRLRDGTKTKDIIKQIQNMKFVSSTAKSTTLKESMEEARKRQFQPINGGRPSARKLIIVIFDGQIKDTKEAIIEANRAKKRGIEIVAIGIKHKNETVIKSISSNPQEKGVNYFLSTNIPKVLEKLNIMITAIQDKELLEKARQAKLTIAKFYKIDVGPKENLGPEFDDIRFNVDQLKYIIRVYERLIKNSKRNKRKAMIEGKEMGRHWEVPINLKANDFKDGRERALLDDLKIHYETNTCIRFQITENEEPYMFPDSGQTGCKSRIGFTSKFKDTGETIHLVEGGCLPRLGVLIHEVGHALGLYHEHQRLDRSPVKINLNATALKFNFVPVELIQTYEIPYDLTSIMHYSITEDFDNWKQTIFPLDKRQSRSLGQRVGLSFFDRKILHKMYCKDNCITKQCDRGGYILHNKCECACPDGLGGTDCNSVQKNSDGCSDEQNIIVEDTEKCISSPNYERDGEYNYNTRCNWWLQAEKGKHIQMKFKGNHFSVYCRNKNNKNRLKICYHWVEIKHSGTFESPGIRFCCKENPNKIEPVISESNEAVVTFRSDFNIEREFGERDDPDDMEELFETDFNFSRKGFKLCFEAVEQGPKPVNYCDDNQCKFNSKCVQEANTYRCECNSTMTGDLCETKLKRICSYEDYEDKDECLTKPKTTPKTPRQQCSRPFVPNNSQLCTNPTCNNPKPKKNCDEQPKCVCPRGKVFANKKCVKKTTCECKDDSNGIKKENDIWMSKDCKIQSTCHRHGKVETKQVKCRKCNKQQCFDKSCADKKKTSVYFDSENQKTLYIEVDDLGTREKKTNVLMGSNKFITITTPHRITMTEQTNNFMTVKYLQFTVTGATSVNVSLSVEGIQREKITKYLKDYKKWKMLSWTPTNDSSIESIELTFKPKSVIKVKELLVQVCIQDS